MSKTFSVGEREWVEETNSDGDDVSYWTIKIVEDDPNLPRGIQDNRLDIQYFEYHRFFREYDLLDVYNGLRPIEPDTLVVLQSIHVDIFEQALTTFKIVNPDCKPMFCWCDVPESKCHCEATYKSADMVRLTWFAHWSRWALENVKEPYFEIM